MTGQATIRLTGAVDPGWRSVSCVGRRCLVDWRDDRVGLALNGTNPTVLRRLDAGFVIGDVRFLPGYSLLLTDDPGTDRLTTYRGIVGPRHDVIRAALRSELERLA